MTVETSCYIYRVPATVVTVEAGFITTTSLLSWMVFSLALYPGDQERLLQELIDYDVKENTDWTPDLADSRPILGILIKEVQRLHNPSYQPERTALADVTIPGGYCIHKEATMIIGMHHLHNNPRVWVDSAKFDPDRWNTDKVKNQHRAA